MAFSSKKEPDLLGSESSPKDNGWVRSQEMRFCRLYLQNEYVYQTVALLGEKSYCHFLDHNQSINSFQKKFVTEIRRCVEMERKIAFFEKEMSRDGIDIIKKDLQQCQVPSMKTITTLEQRMEEMETRLISANNTRVDLKRQLLAFTEFREILHQINPYLPNSPEVNTATEMMRRMSMVDPGLLRRFSTHTSTPVPSPQHSFIMADFNIPLDKVVDLTTITGTILATRFNSFHRMLWRISRGNIFLARIEIDEQLEDPDTGEMQHKCLFILVFQGGELHDKCKKICTAFHANLYTCPDDPQERSHTLAATLSEIERMYEVIRHTDEQRKSLLVAIATDILEWKTTVLKVKSIHETMNMFDSSTSNQCLIGYCWIPKARVDDAKKALIECQTMSNSSAPSLLSVLNTDENPPTYNVTNKFTSGFQNIIDSYGVGMYGEVNPSPFAIITFPFLFAVMFGDAGHGILMALFALWMIFKENKLRSVRNEIFEMFFGGRYIILLMGLFSIYTGAMYNDIFSKSVNLFGTSFNQNWKLLLEPTDCNQDDVNCEHHSVGGKETLFHLEPKYHLDAHYRYYLGIDSIWQLSTNKVQYLNTYKMKISVILGVMQMFFGVMLSLLNHLYYKKHVCIYFVFIPQVIFLLSIFGYMNFMIIFKWFAYDHNRSGVAPSILITLINMFMFKDPSPTDPPYLREEMFEGQFVLQKVLIIMAFLCVPVMLLVKPLWTAHKHKQLSRHNPTSSPKAQEQAQNLFEMTNNNTSNANNTSNTNNENNPTEGNPAVPETGITIECNVDGETAQQAIQRTTSQKKDAEPEIFSVGDLLIDQAIHTIEYCLGSISHTASYLRLWALSLAHAQLSEVLWNMVMKNGFMSFPFEGGKYAAGVAMFIVFAFWAMLTVAILIVMEGLSAFLHALRLHWVEFMSKFYVGSGYPFQPFSFKAILRQIE